MANRSALKCVPSEPFRTPPYGEHFLESKKSLGATNHPISETGTVREHPWERVGLGKRLYIDLSLQRAWTEEISAQDLDSGVGGRLLNGTFFLEQISSSISPSSPEFPIALAVGPLAGTFAPCSGWTSISAFSLLSDPPG